MLRLIGIELFKLKKRWLVYGLLIALLIFTVLPIVTSYASYQSTVDSNNGSTLITITHTVDGEQDEIVFVNQGTEELKDSFTLPGSIQDTFRNMAGLGPILVIILAASSIGSEYRWGTLRQILVKGTARAQYLGSKLIGIAIVTISGIIIALLAGFITSLITTAISGIGISWDFMSADFIGFMFSSFAIILLVLGVYFTLAVLFSTWLRSVTAGISLGIVFIFADNIVHTLLTSSNGWLADIAPYTVSRNVTELTNFNISVAPDPSYWVEPTLILLAYCLVFLASGFYAFRRQDISA